MKKEAPTDFREFVFTATGKDIDLGYVGIVDVYDNIILELDRLQAIAELLASIYEPIESAAASGLALLLKDIHKRARAILSAATHDKKPGPAERR